MIKVKRILVIEDDHNIRNLLKGTFTTEGYQVEGAREGQEGLRLHSSHTPDLVILDRMLPDMDGLEVLRAIRKLGSTPVIFLTVKDDELDKVLGLELGADDYVTKPFSVRELLARVRTVFRRGAPAAPRDGDLTSGNLLLNPDRREVTRNGEPLEMTRTEFDLLLLFMQNPGVVLSREKLLDRVWGYNFEGYQRTVDSHITRLRKKVEADPHDPRLIQTVWGVGYRFTPGEGSTP